MCGLRHSVVNATLSGAYIESFLDDTAELVEQHERTYVCRSVCVQLMHDTTVSKLDVEVTQARLANVALT